MFSILQYPFVTPYTYAASFITDSTPLMRWLLNGKIAENPIVIPTTREQVIRPSGANRYLQSVTVKATA